MLLNILNHRTASKVMLLFWILLISKVTKKEGGKKESKKEQNPNLCPSQHIEVQTGYLIFSTNTSEIWDNLVCNKKNMYISKKEIVLWSFPPPCPLSHCEYVR